jgi:hypothetical protein
VIDIRVARDARCFHNNSFDLGDDVWRPFRNSSSPSKVHLRN